MNEQKAFDYRWLLCGGFAVVAVAIFVALLVSSKGMTPKRITVSIDTNGMALVAGIPMVTTNIRDATFAVMGAAGIKAGFAVPAEFTNKTQERDTIKMLKIVSQAGLFSTNQQRSPYE